jgi:hypothetical protein
MDLGHVAPGLYLVFCTDREGNYIGTYKVQKGN